MARSRGFAALVLLGCAANAAAVELTPNAPLRDLVPHLRYMLADGSSFEQATAIAALPITAFAPLPGASVDLGFTAKTLWLSLEIENRDTEAAGTWLLATDVTYSPDLAIYAVRGDTLLSLLEHVPESRYEDRPVDYRRLAAEFTLDAGEAGRLLIARRPYTPLSLTIESRETFAAARFTADVAAAGIYAALAFAILFAGLQYALLRDRAQLAYLAFISAAALLMADLDGFTFQYGLWPASWYVPVGVPLIGAIAITLVLFVRTFLRTARIAPHLDRCLLGAPIVTIASSFLELARPALRPASLPAWCLLATEMLCLGAGVYAYAHGQRTVRFYLVAWGGLVLALSISVAPVTSYLVPYLAGAALVLDLAMFSLAIADQARETRAQRHAALSRELESRLQQQRLNDQLRAAEAAQLEALVRAAQQAARLATTTHDLKQPLLALRLAIEQLPWGRDVDTGVLEQLTENVAELERLATTVLARAAAPEPPDAMSTHTFPMQLVLDNLTLMFRDEAERQGWRFRCRESAARVHGEALEVVRVLGTLIERLVAHAGRGSLLLGCRRRDGRLRVYVGVSAVRQNATREALEPPLAPEQELSSVRGRRGSRLWTLDLRLAPP